MKKKYILQCWYLIISSQEGDKSVREDHDKKLIIIYRYVIPYSYFLQVCHQEYFIGLIVSKNNLARFIHWIFTHWHPSITDYQSLSFYRVTFYFFIYSMIVLIFYTLPKWLCIFLRIFNVSPKILLYAPNNKHLSFLITMSVSQFLYLNWLFWV